MTITQTILKEINRRFPPEETPLVIHGLSNTSADIAGSERIQFAILKLAQGNLKEFNRMLHLARLDWRDVLVEAGLEEMNWPEVVIAAGMADETWRPGLSPTR